MTTQMAVRNKEPERYWATERPLLHPQMLLPQLRAKTKAFPFDQPNVSYPYFARNAIYAYARQAGLSGADVLMPAYFHGVELEALLAADVKPRFFRVRSGMRVEPEDIFSMLRPETRAVYLIHYIGFPSPVEAVREVCRDRGLLLIEDCALSLLSRANDQPLGSFGDAAFFCVYKSLPTPDGGAAVIQHGSLEMDGTRASYSATSAEIASGVLKHFELKGGTFGKAMAGAIRTVGRSVVRPLVSNGVEVGTQHFNPAETHLLMSDVSRKIIAAQDFNRIVETRRKNYLQLESLLRDLAPPMRAELPSGVCPLFYPFITREKRDMCARLRAKGIEAVDFWGASDLTWSRGLCPEVDMLRATVLELPCHQDMTTEGIERVATAVRNTMRKASC